MQRSIPTEVTCPQATKAYVLENGLQALRLREKALDWTSDNDSISTGQSSSRLSPPLHPRFSTTRGTKTSCYC